MSPALSRRQVWFRRVVQLVLAGVVVVVVMLLLPEHVIVVRTVEISKGDVEEIVSSLQAGEVKAHRRASLRSVTLGRVADIHVERGSSVKEGDLLVELESAALKARVRLARANLVAGGSAVRSTMLRRDAAGRSLARSKKLSAKGVLSAQALDRVQAECDLAKETVTAAEANLAQLKAALDLTVDALDETRISAPFSGRIVSVHIERGESLMVGAPVMDIVDDSGITVVASVDEADAGRLREGMPVRVDCDAYPGRHFIGRLDYIAPVVLKDLRQNRHLEVEVSLPDDTSLLKVGMSADIEIVVKKATDVLNVPTNAVMRKGQVEQVYILQNGCARLRDIKTGMNNWEWTQVVEGLTEGERVIVSLETKGLANGVRVRMSGVSSRQKVAY
ncbi:MAG TPA: efflux RND transporter periplasmic adaptor subunit [Myxococcota bacterium]|nr:efflux RND transporter periplasmic adaptor subunit [Myxococcota bacterium]